MIKFFVFFLALLGLVLLSFPVHELVHWNAADHPTKVCIGLETHNSTNPFTWAAGQTFFYDDALPWYGDEWAAYTVQVAFLLLGIAVLLKFG